MHNTLDRHQPLANIAKLFRHPEDIDHHLHRDTSADYESAR